MPEKINYKLLFETNVKLTSYPSFDFNGFLELYLRQVLILSDSRRAFLLPYSQTDNRVLEFSGSGLLFHESTGKRLTRIVRSEDDDLSDKPFIIAGRIICNKKSRLYLSDNDLVTENVVERYLGFPLEEDSQSSLIILLADKKTDYSTTDFDILSQLSGSFLRTMERLKTINELSRKYELEAEKVKNKDSFIRFISHEVKTPLNSITGFSQLLREENQSAESCNKFTDIILDSSNKLVRFINSVSEMSDIETGLIKTVENDVNISYLFSEIFEQFNSEANLKKLQFQIHNSITDTDSVVLADRDKIKRVITELLTNSFQHTFTGSVTAGCGIKDGNIEFFVTDTGSGISDNYKSKVFCHFLSAGDSALKSSEGAGLGLTISKEFVEHMGGRIWFDSSEGIGTNFFFSIPYKKYVPENIPDSSVEEGVTDKQKVKKSILVAEDDNMNFFLIKVFLSKLGYNLTRAINGREAVELCTSSSYDLILMDIRMPEMDGYTATQKIKENNPKQIIIAQTAYTNDRDTALSKGCDDFIAKPFGRQQLITMIRSYI